MSEDFNRFGAGFAENSGSKYTYYWTQSFGADLAGADTQCLAGGSPPSPTPSAGCFDDPTQSCKHYRDTNLCYLDHVKAACPKSCDACSPGDSPSPPPVCFDDPGQSCQYYRDNDF